MKKRTKIVLLFIGCTSFLMVFSCVDEITFDAPKVGGQLIIEGTITNGRHPHTITVNHTSGKGGIPIPINDAKVWIEDDLGNREQLVNSFFEPDPDPVIGHPAFESFRIEGNYTLLGNIIKGEMGRSYTIEMVLPDGTTYHSKPDTMPTVLASNVARFEIGTETELSADGVISEIGVAQVFLDSDLPSNPFFIKWDVEHTYAFRQTPIPVGGNSVERFCYITDPVTAQGFTLINNDSGLSIRNKLVGSKALNNDFFFISAFNVIQSSISDKAFKYWEQVQEITQNVGTIFDVPGAIPVGNIYNINDEQEIVFGNFQAVARDTSHVILSRVDLPFLTEWDCPITPFNGDRNKLSTICDDCRRVLYSRLKKPTYWPN